MIAITGATGQLGRLVIARLLARGLPPSTLVAAVRQPERAADLAALGVQLRQADYDRPDTLATAFAGVDRLLLISSNEIGRREPQHRAVIEAARSAGVGLLAYTSLLHADSSPLGLAAEHRATEALIRASGLRHVLLRHGWYTENHLAGVPAALQHGALIGAAGTGRFSTASRADYAEAAAVVLMQADAGDRTLELAGDTAYTLAELAAEIARQTGRALPYVDMPPAAYEAALVAAGLPGPLAAMLADSDVGASRGGLFDGSGDLARLIGRPTTPMPVALAVALAT